MNKWYIQVNLLNVLRCSSLFLLRWTMRGYRQDVGNSGSALSSWIESFPVFVECTFLDFLVLSRNSRPKPLNENPKNATSQIPTLGAEQLWIAKLWEEPRSWLFRYFEFSGFRRTVFWFDHTKPATINKHKRRSLSLIDQTSTTMGKVMMLSVKWNGLFVYRCIFVGCLFDNRERTTLHATKPTRLTATVSRRSATILPSLWVE